MSRLQNRTQVVDRVDRDAVHVVVVSGSASGSSTSVPLQSNGVTLATGSGVAVPVVRRTKLEAVAVSWFSSSIPSGSWTVTFKKRSQSGPSFSTAATLTITPI